MTTTATIMMTKPNVRIKVGGATVQTIRPFCTASSSANTQQSINNNYVLSDLINLIFGVYTYIIHIHSTIDIFFTHNILPCSIYVQSNAGRQSSTELLI